MTEGHLAVGDAIAIIVAQSDDAFAIVRTSQGYVNIAVFPNHEVARLTQVVRENGGREPRRQFELRRIGGMCLCCHKQGSAQKSFL